MGICLVVGISRINQTDNLKTGKTHKPFNIFPWFSLYYTHLFHVYFQTVWKSLWAIHYMLLKQHRITGGSWILFPIYTKKIFTSFRFFMRHRNGQAITSLKNLMSTKMSLARIGGWISLTGQILLWYLRMLLPLLKLQKNFRKSSPALFCIFIQVKIALW